MGFYNERKVDRRIDELKILVKAIGLVLGGVLSIETRPRGSGSEAFRSKLSKRKFKRPIETRSGK